MLCILAMTVFTAAPLFATSINDLKPTAPKEPIVVNGDNVEYFQEKKMVTGAGNISIKYKDVYLTCEKITVYLDTREAIAEGNVRVTQKGAYFTGDRMNYNFDTRKGTVLNGYLNAKPFYGKAGEVDKIANKDQFKLNEGYITTCDLEKPHYRIRAKQVEVYLDDKIVARHIVMYVGNVPVLYWPYYVQPLKEKKSHLTIIPGNRKEWGYYALTSYRYYIDDRNKGDLLLDYRTKKGLAEGVNHYYTTKDIGRGAVKLYYTRENAFVYQPADLVRDRYRWQVRHEWDLGEGTDTKALFEFNTMSDSSVIKDYFFNEFEELGATPDNYLSFITQKRGYSTQFLVRKRFDKFLDVVERMPEFSITVPDNNMFKNIPLYYRANAGMGYLNHAFDNTNTNNPLKDQGTGRVDMSNQLSYATKLFRSLSVTPFAAVEDTYYSRLSDGTTNRLRNIFSAGVSNSIKFYRIYDVDTNFLDLDIHKLRHVVTPTVNYTYVHRPSITPNKLYQMDGIDAINRSNGVSFGLENRLQTKRSDGEDNMKSVDLATLLISTTYDFTLNKDGLSPQTGPFSPIDFKLELIPYSWAYIQATMSVDPKNYWVQGESIDLVAHWKDKWSLALSNRYERTILDKSMLVTMDGTYKINEKWKARAYERFNTVSGAIEEQEYTITRDLHCWIGELTYNIKANGGQSIWFVFRLKAFPQTPIGLKQTYSRPRFGEAGSR